VTISAKRLGAALVTGPDGALEGIFTDGDLRRLFESEGNPLAHTIGEVMIRDPKRCAPDDLAAEALKLMEDKSITVLPVVEGNVVVGVLHLHDLLRAGLA
jgi:arabinose-5-phosphate isomerase